MRWSLASSKTGQWLFWLVFYFLILLQTLRYRYFMFRSIIVILIGVYVVPSLAGSSLFQLILESFWHDPRVVLGGFHILCDTHSKCILYISFPRPVAIQESWFLALESAIRDHNLDKGCSMAARQLFFGLSFAPPSPALLRYNWQIKL